MQAAEQDGGSSPGLGTGAGSERSYREKLQCSPWHFPLVIIGSFLLSLLVFVDAILRHLRESLAVKFKVVTFIKQQNP